MPCNITQENVNQVLDIFVVPNDCRPFLWSLWLFLSWFDVKCCVKCWNALKLRHCSKVLIQGFNDQKLISRARNKACVYLKSMILSGFFPTMSLLARIDIISRQSCRNRIPPPIKLVTCFESPQICMQSRHQLPTKVASFKPPRLKTETERKDIHPMNLFWITYNKQAKTRTI